MKTFSILLVIVALLSACVTHTNDAGAQAPWPDAHLKACQQQDRLCRFGFTAPLHSVELLEQIAAASKYGWIYKADGVGTVNEDWTVDYSLFKQMLKTRGKTKFINDCDGVRAYLMLLQELGWYEQYLAETQADVIQTDYAFSDHFIAAVYVPDKQQWYGFDVRVAGKVLPISTLERGTINLKSARIVSHRIVANVAGHWRYGKPVYSE